MLTHDQVARRVHLGGVIRAAAVLRWCVVRSDMPSHDAWTLLIESRIDSPPVLAWEGARAWTSKKSEAAAAAADKAAAYHETVFVLAELCPASAISEASKYGFPGATERIAKVVGARRQGRAVTPMVEVLTVEESERRMSQARVLFIKFLGDMEPGSYSAFTQFFDGPQRASDVQLQRRLRHGNAFMGILNDCVEGARAQKDR